MANKITPAEIGKPNPDSPSSSQRSTPGLSSEDSFQPPSPQVTRLSLKRPPPMVALTKDNFDSPRPEPGELTPLARGLSTPKAGIPQTMPDSSRVIGKGAFGTASIAKTLEGKEIVIKEIHTGVAAARSIGGMVEISQISSYEDKLKVELKALEKVGKHPNIPDLIGSQIKDHVIQIALEKAPGKPLADQQLTEAQTKSVMRQLLSALKYCHENGIAHLDIKPQNMLYDPETDHLSLVDWGEARFFDQTKPAKIEKHLGGGTAAYRKAGSNNPIEIDLYAASKLGLQASNADFITQLQNASSLEDYEKLEAHTWLK